jgi:protein NrfD
MDASVADGRTDRRAEDAGSGHDNMWDSRERRPYVSTTSEVSHPKTWEGPTYYGRSQLKAAPFNDWVVGGYIFLAGLSGGAAIVSSVAETVRGERASGVGARGRYLGTLAPILGAPLLIWDLHTPQRFYNMWRIFKATSPMSIGTWILTAFIPSAMLGAALQFGRDVWPRWPWLRGAARVANAPSVVTGAGISVYTASLLSATSTPYWAAEPRALAMRFGSSSIVSGTAALVLGERDEAERNALNLVLGGALLTELGATIAHHRAVKAKGVGEALKSRWGRIETVAVEGVGILAPLALHAASHLTSDRRKKAALSDLAALCALGGSFMLRVSALSVGGVSARRPEVSFRFSQPENLPKGHPARSGPAR